MPEVALEHREPISERHGRLLAAFAERAARLAAELADRALAAEDPAVAADLARAFHAVGRSLRQAIALEQRLERDAARSAREAADDQARMTSKRLEARRTTVRNALRGLVYTETEALDVSGLEDEDAEEAVAELYGQLMTQVEQALDAAVEDPAAFLAEPLAAQVARLAVEAGLADTLPPADSS